MRSPPPVLPPENEQETYKSSLFDREGPDAALRMKAIGYALARFLLASVGRLSDGIAIGHVHGFDSGLMLDHVYANKARGRAVVGRLIDRIYLDAPGWAGIRNRGALLQRRIVDEVRRVAARRGDAIVADLACGGGRYLLGALAEVADEIAFSATFRDYDPANVARARTNTSGPAQKPSMCQTRSTTIPHIIRVSPKTGRA